MSKACNRIFTITPGRSGIHYLSNILLNFTDLPNTAEPEYFPKFNSLSNNSRSLFVDKIWDELPKEYVCTSLLPKNGYLKMLAKKGARFIHLTRNARDVAYSWWRLCGIPGKPGRGEAYHLPPNFQGNCIQVKESHTLNEYQLCYWWVIEVQQRAYYLKNLGYDVYEVNINDLNTKENVINLFNWINRDLKFNIDEKFIGSIINQFDATNKRFNYRPLTEDITNFDELENQVIELINENTGEVDI